MGGEHHVDEADGACRVGLTSHVEQRSEVVLGAVGVRLGLVGDRPQHDAGVVLVAGDELADGLGVHLAGVVVDGLGRERLVALAAEDAAAEAHVQPHGRGLVDDDDAVPVGVVEDVLAVGVVRGAERVRPDPVQQLEVVDEVGVVVALAEDRVVLVLAETFEVERLAVDQELGAANLHGADADVLVDRVPHDASAVDELDLEVVEVSVAGCPEADVGHVQGAARPAPGGDLGACGVA